MKTIKTFELLEEIFTHLPTEVNYIISRFIGKKLPIAYLVQKCIMTKTTRKEKHVTRHYINHKNSIVG